ncbi:MAG: hypothetical protein OXU45_08555 [Candidatus Melainabacteria bacterium]|nr:hypothetical protein [Candidatus Melainabacteria bacterium]
MLISLLSLFFLSSPAWACTCGTETINAYGFGGPVLTIPAYTLPKGKLALGASLQYNNFNQFSSARRASLNASRIHAHSFDSAMTNTLSAAYGITDDLDLILSYPYRYKYNLQTTFAGVTIDEGDSIGFGDLTLLTKYRLFQSKTQISLLGGIKFPTGQTNERNEFGLRLGTDDQPGTGSWDPLMGFAISRPYKAFSFDGNLLYRLSNQGSGDVIAGDIASYNLAASYKFDHCTDFTLVLEMNGIWQEKTEFAGIKDDNHGGNVIYLNPGFRVNLGKIAWNMSVGFPIINDLNGFQPEAGIQLYTGLNLLI